MDACQSEGLLKRSQIPAPQCSPRRARAKVLSRLRPPFADRQRTAGHQAGEQTAVRRDTAPNRPDRQSINGNGLSLRNVDFTVKQRRRNGIRISGSNARPSAEMAGSEVAQDRTERLLCRLSCFSWSTSFRCALHHHEHGLEDDTLSLIGESAPAFSVAMRPVPPTSMSA